MPIFVLCAALYRINDYLSHDQPLLTDIKFRLWYHDNVVFHSYSIRKRVYPFQALVDANKEQNFRNEINRFFDKSKVTLIASAIHKPRHKEKYIAPENPYFLSTQFVLERIFGEIRNKGGRTKETVCVLEGRGKKENRIVQTWFDEICSGQNQWRCPFPFRAQFAPKKANMAGLQVADLAAYPIARYVENPEIDRSDFKVIEPRIRRNGAGNIIGYGLKIFP